MAHVEGARVRVEGVDFPLTVVAVSGAAVAVRNPSTGQPVEVPTAIVSPLAEPCAPTCRWVDEGDGGACKKCGTIVHGAERNRRQQTDYGEVVEFQDARTGKTVYRGAGSAHTYSVSEVYCAPCGGWKRQAGIIAFVVKTCPDCGGSLERAEFAEGA